MHKGKQFSEVIDQPDENCAYQGPGNGTVVANGKGSSRFPFSTEKVDYFWRLSTICEKIFPRIAFPFDHKTKFPDFLAKWKAPQYLLRTFFSTALWKSLSCYLDNILKQSKLMQIQISDPNFCCERQQLGFCIEKQ